MNEIINLLKNNSPIPDSYSVKDLEIPFELKPQDFIEFATKELEEGTLRNYVNVLSNVKRAIDCQIELILFCWGFYNISKQQSWNFPKKIKLIKDLGIIAPRILEKINKKRNNLEHDFKKPSKENAEDFLDVAILFVSYTSKFLKRFDGLQISFEEIEEDDQGRPFLSFNHNEGNYEITLIDKQKKDKITIESNDADYLFITKLLIEWIKKH